MTFTKEQLIAAAHGRIDFANMMLSDNPEPLKERTWSIELELARIALSALLERAEPVAWMYLSKNGAANFRTKKPRPRQGNSEPVALYTAPPAPVVPCPICDGVMIQPNDKKDWGCIRCGATAGQVTTIGNQVAVPDGWVLVPVEPTKEMIDAGWSYYMTTKSTSSAGVYGAMLAAAPGKQPLSVDVLAGALRNAPLAPSDNQGRQRAPITDGWIACSERMPPRISDTCIEYLVYESLNNRVHHDYWNVPEDKERFQAFWNHYGDYVTHWMPLPAAPGKEG
ncbi:DUF551 domain-containing protein [Cronobacter dublinensis]